MPITQIDGFKVNTEVPIDIRVTATNSINRDKIEYAYDGLLVYQIDTKVTYVWNQSKFISTGLTSTSWDISESMLTGQGTNSYMSKWDSTGIGLTSSSVISKLYYGENFQRVGVGVSPLEAFQINSNYLTFSNYLTPEVFTSSGPFIIHKGSNTVIGDNWYYDSILSEEKFFDNNSSSNTVTFKQGGMEFKGKTSSQSELKTILKIEDGVIFDNYITITSSSSNGDNGSISYNGDRILIEEDNFIKNMTSEYDVYSGILSQSGVSDPSSSVLDSTIGSATWSYVGVGIYNLSLSSTYSFMYEVSGMCGPYTSSSIFFGRGISNNTYQINTLNSPGGILSNDQLNQTFIEIKFWKSSVSLP